MQVGNSSIQLNADVFRLIFRYLKREEVLHFLETCRYAKQFDFIFFEIYFIHFLGDDLFSDAFKKKIRKIKNYKITKNSRIYENLIEICFNDYFNQKVIEWPISIKYIKFGKFFNQSIADLPDSICRLKLGSHFRQPITKLPKNLQYIKVDYMYAYIDKIKDVSNCEIEEVIADFDKIQPNPHTIFADHINIFMF